MIKSISALVEAIPPLIIFGTVMHQAAWYESALIPAGWFIAVSENGWTMIPSALNGSCLFSIHTYYIGHEAVIAFLFLMAMAATSPLSSNIKPR